ncbi:hypothetical protein, partial [Klebsiella pneumoniae]|uniref:hypothetical protein n=1 Tax=Klebsiella pneumoniae TaxID=573 RepID=UPI0024DE3B88
MLVHQYELFKMLPEENVSDMFARLTAITNGLKALGRTYPDAELVRKVLRTLTPAWHTKATAIEESKDLSVL